MSADRDRINAAPSREASNQLLAVLSDGRWHPRAWVRFLALATLRSVHTAGAHPRRLIESTVIHLVMGALSNRRGLAWIAVSWIMAITHLGMLGDRHSIGIPNALTLIRGNLPAIDHRLGRALPVISLATDFADGRIARATGAVTPFGTQADFLADTAFWTWFAVRHDPSRVVRALTLASWAVPVVGIAVASMTRGRMLDLPRSAVLRPAAAMEVVIGLRAILRLLPPSLSLSSFRSWGGRLSSFRS